MVKSLIGQTMHRRLPADELARLAICGDVAALRELARRGDDAAKLAIVEVVRAKRRGSPRARRAIDVCNEEAVRRLSRTFEAGRLPGIKRDIGHGPELHAQWLARCGHAPRPGGNARVRGSRRHTSSRATSSGDGSDPPPRAGLAARQPTGARL